LQRSPWILDEQQVVGEEVQRLNLEVAVEEVLQVVQVEEELQVLQIQVEEELQVVQIQVEEVVQVEEELQVGEVLHAHCLLMQVLASLEGEQVLPQVFVVAQLLWLVPWSLLNIWSWWLRGSSTLRSVCPSEWSVSAPQ